MLGSPSNFEYRDKISLKNFETGRGIKILDHFFIEYFFNNDLTKYITKTNLCIIL